MFHALYLWSTMSRYVQTWIRVIVRILQKRSHALSLRNVPLQWEWGNLCILDIPYKIIHSCDCVYSSWKQWLDHNQHFLVWYILLSDKVEQRYSGPLDLRPSAFFTVKVEEILQFHQHSFFIFFFSDYHFNLLGMINENLVSDSMCLQVCD